MVPITILEGLWVLFAGAMEAIVPVALMKNGRREQRLIYLFLGIATTTFVAPGMNEYFLPDASRMMQGAVAFVFCLVGLNLSIVIVRLVGKRGETIVDCLLGSVLGAPTNKEK
ncbi:MAG: hypothetical protein H7240_04815 [Glaciimonas sp.]|nr:hypothetical protein [Glaciimonas sp.]